MDLGSPSTAQKDRIQCEDVKVNIEFCNDEAAVANQEIRHAEIVAAVVAAGATFENGDAVTADNATFQFANQVELCAVREGVLVQLDDGTQKRVTCDDAGVLVDQPENGNASALSGGAVFQLGGGPEMLGIEIDTDYLVSLLPGAAVAGKVVVSRCWDSKDSATFIDRSAL